MNKENKKVPKLRFPGFTEDWEQRKLGEIVSVCSGRDYKHLKEGNIPVYGTGGYITSTSGALSKNEDAIGIGRKGTIDNPFVLKSPFWTVDTLFYCIPSVGYDLNFVYGIYQNINWKQMDESTGVPSLSKTSINKVKVFTPSIDEQKRIGCLFLEFDHLITLHQRKLENVKELKKGLLQKMFPKNGEKVPELRFPGFTEDWEQRKLGDIGSTFTGLTGKSKEDFGHGEARFITYMNVFTNEIIDLDMVDKVEIDVKQNKVEKGDIFFTTSSEISEEVGMSSVLTENIGDTYLNSFCFGFRPIANLDEKYMAYMLRTPYTRRKIALLGQGISRYNISKKKLLEIEIPLPNIEEQKKIGEYLFDVSELITLHQRKLAHLKEMKKGLLQQMFV